MSEERHFPEERHLLAGGVDSGAGAGWASTSRRRKALLPHVGAGNTAGAGQLNNEHHHRRVRPPAEVRAADRPAGGARRGIAAPDAEHAHRRRVPPCDGLVRPDLYPYEIFAGVEAWVDPVGVLSCTRISFVL